MGWMFLGIGLFFGTIFAPLPRTAYYLLYLMGTKSTTGTAIEWQQTRMTRGGSRGHAGSPVFATRFSFAVDGKTYEGVSYDMSPTAAGASVTVEYPAGFPAVARIQGMGLTAAGPAAAFVYLFAVVGLMMVLRGLRRGLAAIPLLTGGILALGKLEGRSPTRLSLNRRVVYRLFYSFTAVDTQTHQAITSDEFTKKFDYENEPVLYDPQNPASALVVKGLPCTVAFDESGNPTAGVLDTAISLAVPAAAILGNVLFAYWV